MTKFIVKDVDTGDTWEKESRKEAEKALEDFGDKRNLEIIPPTESDGGEVQGQKLPIDEQKTDEPIDVRPSSNQPTNEEMASDDSESGPLIADMNLSDDPLDVLPSYMITQVDGKPSLNKRGVSVLAYHFDIDVVDREVVAYPHNTKYETAVVQFMVKGADGRKFSGMGEAHVDETPKHQLLRMAETRAYKRAVIFATGTGIVGYQELMEEL